MLKINADFLPHPFVSEEHSHKLLEVIVFKTLFPTGCGLESYAIIQRDLINHLIQFIITFQTDGINIKVQTITI
jgi:hypothetical protein